MSKSCTDANMVHSRAERVFILENYFTSKSFADVREAFSNAYPDKEVPNETTVYRLVTKFRDTRNVCDRKHVRRRTVLTDETLCSVGETLARSPQKSEKLVPAKWIICAFGRRDLQTFCGHSSKKLFIGITHEAWKN
jgi:hypothetical protein